MNSRVSQKILSQCIKRNHRFLNVQQNVNKCGVAHYTVNFYRKNEYNSSCAHFSKHLLHKDSSYIPLYINFQKRNISDEDLVKTPSIVKKDTPPPVENTESTLSPDSFLPDYIIQMYKDTSTLENMVQFPDVLLPLCESQPVQFMQEVILALHHDTGLPWWATFALTGVFIRTFFLLPLGANQMRIKSKLQRMEEYMTKYKAKLKEEQKEYKRYFGLPKELLNEEFARKVKEEAIAQYRLTRIHPNKVYFLGMIETFTWVVTSLAIRNICHALPPSVAATELYKELSFGGISWIMDLTLPDSTLILPFVFIMTNSFIIDAYKSFNTKTNLVELKALGCHAINLSLIPVAICAQNAVCIYWITNSVYGLLQIYLLHTPVMLRLLRASPVRSKDNYSFYYDLRKANKQKQIKAT